jgi:hypothetical protein
MLKIQAWLDSYAKSSSVVYPFEDELLPALKHLQTVVYHGRKLTGATPLTHALAALQQMGYMRKTYVRLKGEIDQYKRLLYATAPEFQTQDNQRARVNAWSQTYWDMITLKNIFGHLWEKYNLTTLDPRFALLRAIEYVFQNETLLQESMKHRVTVAELRALVAAGEAHHQVVQTLHTQNTLAETALAFAQQSIEKPRVAIADSLKVLHLGLTLLQPNTTHEVVYHQRLREELIKLLKDLGRKLMAPAHQRTDILGVALAQAEQTYEKHIQLWQGEACVCSQKEYATHRLLTEEEQFHQRCSQLFVKGLQAIIPPVEQVISQLQMDTEKRRLSHLLSLFDYLKQTLEAELVAIPVPTPLPLAQDKEDWLYKHAMLADVSRCMKYVIRLMQTGNMAVVLAEEIAKLETNTFGFMKSGLCAESLFVIEEAVQEKIKDTPKDYALTNVIQIVDEYIPESYAAHLKEIPKIQVLPEFKCAAVMVDVSGLDLKEEMEAALLKVKDRSKLEAYRKVVGSECSFKVLWEAVMTVL